jgi:hypothetical protein
MKKIKKKILVVSQEENNEENHKENQEGNQEGNQRRKSKKKIPAVKLRRKY